MKQWITPALVVVGLIGLGFGIRTMILKRSSSAASPTTQSPSGEAGGPGAEAAAIPGNEPGIEPVDPSEPQDWEATYHPFLGFPSEPGPPEEIMIKYAKGRAEHPTDDMVKVPAGEFLMGNDKISATSPARNAFVKAFQLDRYEVTRENYRKFLVDTSHPQPALPDEWAKHYSWRVQKYPRDTGEHPVTLVNFADAVAFCRWAGKRLPTESEWEKAARGPGGFLYPWGNKWDGRKSHTVERLSGPLRTRADWQKFGEKEEEGINRPFPVGSYPEDASGYGAYDMHGNVHEWVDAPFEPYDGGNDDASPLYEQRGIMVARGASYANRDYAAPVTARFPYEATMKDVNIGFRCAKDL